MTEPQRIGRLVWDRGQGAVSDGNTRYLVLRADSLMDTFASMPADSRRVALECFEESVHRHGAQSLARYVGARGGRTDELCSVVVEVAAQLGWGAWQLDVQPAKVRLVVAHSPFAAGYGKSDAPICMPIVGMLRALANLLTGTSTFAVETECAASGATVCQFEALPGKSDK